MTMKNDTTGNEELYKFCPKHSKKCVFQLAPCDQSI